MTQKILQYYTNSTRRVGFLVLRRVVTAQGERPGWRSGYIPMVRTGFTEQDGGMTFDSNTPRQFTRSDSQKMLAGVCGGIAEYFSVDVNLVRLLTVVATLVTGGTAALVYLAARMLMP